MKLNISQKSSAVSLQILHFEIVLLKYKFSVWVMHSYMNYILSFPNPEKWAQTVQTNHCPSFFAIVSGFFSVTLF